MIDFMTTRQFTLLELNDDLYTKTMNLSKGNPTMFDNDVKMALIALKGIVDLQGELIKTLSVELAAVKKKNLIKRIFNK